MVTKLKDNEYYLPCYDSHKSFYNKAVVITEETKEHFRKILRSYDTEVCYIEDGVLHKTWDGYSATTMRHVQSFCRHYNIECGGKKWWEELQVEK